MQDISLQFFKASAPTGQNHLFSPYSFEIVLHILSLGSEDEMRQFLSSLLGILVEEKELQLSVLSNLTETLSTINNGRNTFIQANALWYSTEVSPAKELEQILTEQLQVIYKSGSQ